MSGVLSTDQKGRELIVEKVSLEATGSGDPVDVHKHGTTHDHRDIPQMGAIQQLRARITSPTKGGYMAIAHG